MSTHSLLTAALLALVAAGLPSVSLAQEAAPAAPAAEAEVDIGHQVPPGFTTDVAAARAAAKAADRPLLFMVCIPHCGPCNQLKHSVLPRPEVRDNLAEYELVYVNAEDSPALAKELKIAAYPTFVLQTPAGREIGRHCGGSDDPATFLDGMEGLRHQHDREVGIGTALAKNPQDLTLLVARARLLLDKADQSLNSEPLRQKAVAVLKAAARLDPEDQTGAAGELAWLDHEDRSRGGLTEAEYKAKNAEAFALWKAHPDLRRGDLALWGAIQTMPEKEAAIWQLELLRRYPDSPQVLGGDGWDKVENALGKKSVAAAPAPEPEPAPALAPTLAVPATPTIAAAPAAANVRIPIGLQVPQGFTPDLAAARAAAQAADRPLLVMFALPHDEACNHLKRWILPRAEVRINLAEYELAYVNADAAPALAWEFGVANYPAFVLLTPAGRELGRIGGASDNPAAFLRNMEALRHNRERRAGVAMALAKNPQDPALLVARARRTLDLAQQTPRPGALLQVALADLKTAAALDPDGKTDAAAEITRLALEERSRQPMTPEEYVTIGNEVLALWKAHPSLNHADLVLWSAISDMPPKLGARHWLEFVRRYPDSPKADQGWQLLRETLKKQ